MESTATIISPLAETDPRSLFARAVAVGGSVIGAVRPDQFNLPTPCTEFDVRELLGHLVGVLRRVAAIGRAEDPFSVDMVVDVADDAWSAAWLDAAHEVQAAWAYDAVLNRIVVLPWAQLPGSATLLMYCNEVTVHAWDLAAATGQRPEWDVAVVEASYQCMQIGLPAEGRVASFEEAFANMPPDAPRKYPFGEAVAVSADASPIDRLVAWNGRTPV